MSRNGEARRYCQKPTLLGGNNPHFRRSQWATDAWPPTGGFRLRSHSQSMTGLIVLSTWKWCNTRWKIGANTKPVAMTIKRPEKIA
jgi:hypothetical protein